MRVGGGSPLRAVMVGTARAGQGVHHEVESEGSCSPKLGLDEQESDTRPVAFEGIRSDDVFKPIGNLCTQPELLGLADAADIAQASVLILVSLMVGVILALATYALGSEFARLTVGRTAKLSMSKHNP